MKTIVQKVFLEDPILFIIGALLMLFGSIIGIITGHAERVILLWLLIATIGFALKTILR